MSKKLKVPAALDEQGRRACEIILAFLAKEGVTDDDGGGLRFVTPSEWLKRSDSCLDETCDVARLKLVVLHAGGDAADVFNPPAHRDAEAVQEELTALLGDAGLGPELCHEWSTFIWELREGERKVVDSRRTSPSSRSFSASARRGASSSGAA